MRILYINHYAGSPVHGMEFRPYYLAREWVKAGHQVHIVAASYSHLRQHNPDMTFAYQAETIEGIEYLWCKTPAYSGNGLKRVLNIFSFLAKLWRRSRYYTRNWCPDVVIASSTYPMDTWLAAYIARKTGAKIVYEVHDLWPLTPIEVGGMSPSHPFIRLMQAAEDFGYRRADTVISMLPCAKSYMMQHGMAAEKYHVIPNGVDVEAWSIASEPLPALHAKIIEQSRGFLIGYVGGHGLANALAVLIEAAALVQDLDLTFLLLGDGPNKVDLQKQVQGLGLQNIVFLPSIPKRAVPTFLAKMDALFIGWRRLPIYRFGINPNKLFDYMMASKPIIHSVEAGNDWVKEAGAGISVEPESPQAIAQAVRQLYALPLAQRQAMGHAGFRYVKQHHDYSVLAAQFLRAL